MLDFFVRSISLSLWVLTPLGPCDTGCMCIKYRARTILPPFLTSVYVQTATIPRPDRVMRRLEEPFGTWFSLLWDSRIGSVLLRIVAPYLVRLNCSAAPTSRRPKSSYIFQNPTRLNPDNTLSHHNVLYPALASGVSTPTSSHGLHNRQGTFCFLFPNLFQPSFGRYS